MQPTNIYASTVRGPGVVEEEFRRKDVTPHVVLLAAGPTTTRLYCRDDAMRQTVAQFLDPVTCTHATSDIPGLVMMLVESDVRGLHSMGLCDVTFNGDRVVDRSHTYRQDMLLTM